MNGPYLTCDAKKHPYGPLFNPFETLTPKLIAQKVAEKHFFSEPTSDDYVEPTDRQLKLTRINYYPTKVDLPNSLELKRINNKIRANLGRRRDIMDGFEFTQPANDDNDHTDPNEIPDEVWVPDRALEAISMERQLDPEITDTALANKILKENLPLVAVGLTHTAKYSSDQRLRFQAQTYIMDRVLGKVGTIVVTEDSPIDDLNKQLMQLVEATIGERNAD